MDVGDVGQSRAKVAPARERHRRSQVVRRTPRRRGQPLRVIAGANTAQQHTVVARAFGVVLKAPGQPPDTGVEPEQCTRDPRRQSHGRIPRANMRQFVPQHRLHPVGWPAMHLARQEHHRPPDAPGQRNLHARRREESYGADRCPGCFSGLGQLHPPVPTLENYGLALDRGEPEPGNDRAEKNEGDSAPVQEQHRAQRQRVRGERLAGVGDLRCHVKSDGT